MGDATALTSIAKVCVCVCVCVLTAIKQERAHVPCVCISQAFPIHTAAP